MADASSRLQARQLALQLHSGDVESVEQGEKAGKRKRESSDSEASLGVHREGLEASVALGQDQALSSSSAQAVGSDGGLVQNPVAEHDPNKARVQGNANDMATATAAESSGAHLVSSSSMHAQAADDTEAQSPAGDSAIGEDVETRACAACGDDYEVGKLVKCPCPHEYCCDCLTSLFELALVDESLFPPRCCKKPIPVDDHADALGLTLVGKFKAKAVELGTPNRTYCHKADCAAFVAPSLIRDGVATCGRCKAETCVSCKGARHVADCPKDKTTQDLLRMAKEKGWQRCYSCHRMVELGVGCNHITCICRAQFCYLCGVPWKNCPCPPWDVANLFDRAEVVADRDAGNRELQGERRDQVVRRAMADLERNHGCIRHMWTYRRARRNCEECHQAMPDFIYECDYCHVMVCNRCRLNRF